MTEFLKTMFKNFRRSVAFVRAMSSEVNNRVRNLKAKVVDTEDVVTSLFLKLTVCKSSETRIARGGNCVGFLSNTE